MHLKWQQFVCNVDWTGSKELSLHLASYVGTGNVWGNECYFLDADFFFLLVWQRWSSSICNLLSLRNPCLWPEISENYKIGHDNLRISWAIPWTLILINIHKSLDSFYSLFEIYYSALLCDEQKCVSLYKKPVFSVIIAQLPIYKTLGKY